MTHDVNQYARRRVGLGSSILVNPLVGFLLIWGITLFLFSLQATTQLVPLSETGALMIGMNAAFAALMYLFFRTILKPTVNMGEVFSKESEQALVGFSKRLRIMWLIGSAIEIAVSGGLPLQWALTGQGFLKDYTDFGIPSFHGLMNAFYLQFMTAEFLLWRVMKRQKSRKTYLIFLVWPIMMLGRGIFLSIVIQSLACFLLFNKINLRKLIRILMLVVANVVLFGAVGNIRGRSNPFGYLIVEKFAAIFDFLPTGFLWVYIYMTSPVNNLFFNVDVVEPLYKFEKSFSNMLPNFVKNLLGLDRPKNIFIFADSNLNVSTMYAGFVSDFGALGGWVMVSFILMVAIIVYMNAQRLSLAAILCYSVIFQVIIFSIFVDMFFLLPTLMQMFIALSFSLCKKSHPKNVL